MKRWKNIILFLVLCSNCVVGQNKTELIKTKNRLLNEAKLIDSAIKINEDGQKRSLEELLLINRNVEIQSEIIDLSESYLRILKTEQDSVEVNLLKNVEKLSSEKELYKTLIISAKRIELLFNPILFFMSSSSFNQFIRTIYHFRQLEITRRKKYNLIKAQQLNIENQKDQLLEKKAKQATLLMDQRLDFETLKNSERAQRDAINQLKLQKDSLAEELEKKKLETIKISDAIIELIQKENKQNSTFELTPTGRVVSEGFEKNKGQLNWPVKNGIVVSNFGKVQHPILPTISTINNGIEIATSDINIKSVFRGRVSKILILPNGLKVAIVRHGIYLTVYSDLYEVSVVNGQEINVHDQIGTLHNKQQKQPNTFGFQIWRGREKLNPTEWLLAN